MINRPVRLDDVLNVPTEALVDVVIVGTSLAVMVVNFVRDVADFLTHNCHNIERLLGDFIENHLTTVSR